MKGFLDDTFEEFNGQWNAYKPKIESAQTDFESGVEELVKVFGESIARKPGSPQFNRAVFDALIFYYCQPSVRRALQSKRVTVKKAYQELFASNSAFLKAVESDTAGAPNTLARLKIWGKELSKIAGQTFSAPKIPIASGRPRATRRKGAKRATRRR